MHYVHFLFKFLSHAVCTDFFRCWDKICFVIFPHVFRTYQHSTTTEPSTQHKQHNTQHRTTTRHTAQHISTTCPFICFGRTERPLSHTAHIWTCHNTQRIAHEHKHQEHKKSATQTTITLHERGPHGSLHKVTNESKKGHAHVWYDTGTVFIPTSRNSTTSTWSQVQSDYWINNWI